jgi:multidrug resistance efflux pump
MIKSIIRTLFWLVLVGGAVGGGIAYSLREIPVKVTVTTVTRGMVTETVAAITSGTVTAPKTAKVAAGGIGTVSAVHVKEGDIVTEGAPLLELAHAELDAQVALALANQKVGESRISQARIVAQTAREVSEIQLRSAESTLELAQSDFSRVKALTEKQAISQSDYDKASLALKSARDAKAGAESGLREALVRDEDVHIAEANIEQLKAALNTAEAMRDKAFVRAPFPGVVARVITQLGEAVVMGMPVVYMVQAEGAYIEAPFDEANLESLKIGQPAEIEIDSMPGSTFKGTLTYIAPVVTMAEQLSRSLLCKVSIDESPEKFRHGMSADVTIITDKKDDVPFVPSEALVRDRYAYVVEGDRAVQRDVETGIGNWDQREILDGLKVDDTIITSISIKALKDGAKVQVVEALED